MSEVIESAELRPQVSNRRRRRWRAVAGAIFAAQGLAIGLLVAWPSAPAPTVSLIVPVESVTTHTIMTPFAMPVPMVIETSTPAPPTSTLARPACPPPRDDAPRVKRTRFDDDVTNVIAAPTNAGWIAAWNGTNIYASRDAGATFAPVLEGHGTVRGVSFDCYGRVIAVRDDRVGMHDIVGETWHRIPGMHLDDDAPEGQPVSLAGGGPDIVMLAAFGDDGHARIVVSKDDGASWRGHDLGAYWEGGRGSTIAEDTAGNVNVMVLQPDCRETGLWWLKTHVDHLDKIGNGALDDYETVGEGVAVYGDFATDGRRWRKHGGGDFKWIDGLPKEPMWGGSEIPGAYPTVAYEDRVYRISPSGKARDLGLVVGNVTSLHVDRANRVWGIICGDPVVLGREYIEQTCGADI